MAKLSENVIFDRKLETSIRDAANVLLENGVLLCPTDTIWGLSVLPDSEIAIEKLRKLKGRSADKPFILLVPDKTLLQKITGPLAASMLKTAVGQEIPTSIIYHIETPLVSSHVLAEDGTLAIRVVSSGFCHELMKYLQQPLISTSANYSGKPSPQSFDEIEKSLIEKVDGCVPLAFAPHSFGRPSRILRYKSDGSLEVIRP